MGDVVQWTGWTTNDIDVDQVLEAAVGQLKTGMIIGWDKESHGLYLASSTPDVAELLWMLEIVKKRLLEIGSGEY